MIRIIRYKSIKICEICKNIGHQYYGNAFICIRCNGRHRVCFLGKNKFTCKFCVSKFTKRDIAKVNHKIGYALCPVLMDKMVRGVLGESAFGGRGDNLMD